jgi:DMSO/TMAO reductase YedYZ molybdopterin-dependent catalytic subunit
VERPTELRVGRRVFLGMVGLGVGGVLFGAKAADLLERVIGPLSARDVTGLLSLFPVGRFRIYSVTNSLPSRTPEEYRLTVDGAVGTPLSLALGDLHAMAPTHLTKDFQCVTGWRVHDVKWTGVRLADVLDRAGAAPDAWGVRFTSFDGLYTETLTMSQARRPDVLVAYEMAGGPVTQAHGGPVRLYVAPMYGYKSCKWLGRVEVVHQPAQPGYWEQRGYDVDAWVGRSNGRDDSAI